MQLPAGTRLQAGKYTIERMLGQGGFGITYKGIQAGLNRPVAIKEFYMGKICERSGDSADVSVPSYANRALWEGFKQKFLKEARTIASLSHPHIVNVIDVFEENGTAYYAMEFLPGKSLRQVVKERGTLPEKRGLEIMRTVGGALEYIHSKSILHLDIKPDNIMMKDGDYPVIIDFGISKRYDETGTQTSMMPVGRSVGYAPIEQYKQGGLASFSPATDVYSLAATMYYLYRGERPPEPKEIYDNGLPLLPNISAATMDGILKGMAVRRADRPQSVAEFLAMFPSTSAPPQPAFDVEAFRSLVSTLEASKNYKEAYNICIENVTNGNDVEFARRKSTELVAKMKKKRSLQSVIAVIVAIAVMILVAIVQATV